MPGHGPSRHNRQDEDQPANDGSFKNVHPQSIFLSTTHFVQKKLSPGRLPHTSQNQRFPSNCWHSGKRSVCLQQQDDLECQVRLRLHQQARFGLSSQVVFCTSTPICSVKSGCVCNSSDDPECQVRLIVCNSQDDLECQVRLCLHPQDDLDCQVRLCLQQPDDAGVSSQVVTAAAIRFWSVKSGSVSALARRFGVSSQVMSATARRFGVSSQVVFATARRFGLSTQVMSATARRFGVSSQVVSATARRYWSVKLGCICKTDPMPLDTVSDPPLQLARPSDDPTA